MSTKNLIRFFVVLICFSLFLYCTGIGCPILYATGISCPSCGMTRAWLCFFTLDLRGAFSHHPLFFTIPFLIPLALFYKKIPKALFYSTLGLFLFSFLLVYILRMYRADQNFLHADISKGWIFQTLKSVYIMLRTLLFSL